MAEITQLLVDMRNGSTEAASELMRRVYSELHRLAVAYMRRERPDHTLQPTALVNETYLRLVGQREISWQNRAQFFGVAAQMMRRILVDHARTRLAARHGGCEQRFTLDDAMISPKTECADLVALDDALTRLARIDTRQSQVVELRFFAGLTVKQTAKILGLSEKTVERDWMVARAWLHGQIARR
jgi:RNA polymerase sigma factor (TIGR02999 family)